MKTSAIRIYKTERTVRIALQQQPTNKQKNKKGAIRIVVVVVVVSGPQKKVMIDVLLSHN
jgi:hypothetical protein